MIHTIGDDPAASSRRSRARSKQIINGLTVVALGAIYARLATAE